MCSTRRSSCRKAPSAIRSTTDAGAAIFKVVEKHESSPQDLTANKETFREEILNDRKNRFFSSYMQKAKQKMKISVNREALSEVVG